jgi:SAM-dependent methyltransferase
MSPRRKREWFDNDTYWRDLSPFLFTEARITAAKGEIDQVIRLTGIKKGSALDLCCGPGRCTVALAKKRFKVTGVDRTKFLLDKARARARAAKVKTEFIQKDMRDFVRSDSFDLVLSMYTSFGYFANPDDDLTVLRNVYTSLRRGGTLLIDVIGKERLAKIFLATSETELPDGSLLMERRKIIDDWTRIHNEWIIIRNGQARSYKFDFTVYSGRELRELMERAGFKRVKLYGSFDGAPYDRNALRLIAVGRKV